MISPGVIIAPASQVAMQTPTGTINVDATIYREWGSLASHTTVSGGDVQSYLGWPLRLFVTRSGAGGLYFERGVMLLRPYNRCFAVYGAIYVHYRALIDLENPAAGFNIGLPVAEDEAVANGRPSRFDACDIYFYPRTANSFELHGAIRAHWAHLAALNPFLAHPLYPH